jgi:hypothetical protein
LREQLAAGRFPVFLFLPVVTVEAGGLPAC